MLTVIMSRIQLVSIVVCGATVVVFVYLPIGIVYPSLKPTDIYVIKGSRD